MCKRDRDDRGLSHSCPSAARGLFRWVQRAEKRDMANAEEQAQRNKEILLDRMANKSVNEIAKARNLSAARVRQILATGVQVLADDRIDPIQVALELRAELELVFD